ncbi:GMC family oxidoreductase [Corallococcus macrosporus]|uniref:GMC family oxidoreductase n=1 Tax=Corallococcus macrosporus TaxID=35 RepID=A0ABS3D710_9BACT|nr:GMC oxidoreductase [Corallococcus macrosporus]MBN8227454.1 GMC family oxidoreductase [Corallococcus macrosporus]
MSAASSTPNFQHGFPTPGPQSPTGQRVMDHVFFLSNEGWKEAREEKKYDLVIVGTGFCGLAVAHRALEQNPHCRILMLERGPFFLPEHFQNLPLPFVGTLGGMSETFPWTLAASTASGADGTVTWQHGMVPFFGGRSTLWSAWCPRPKGQELQGWPGRTIAAAEENFARAEALLQVHPADKVDAHRSPEELRIIQQQRPVYGALQLTVQNLLAQGYGQVPTIYRTEPAPLASGDPDTNGIDFQKYSTPGALLELVMNQRQLALENKGAPLDVATECIVESIVQQEGTATALMTSRGVLPLNDAKLILAMGTLPPTTLVRNSFPQLRRVGERFSAHFITSLVARVPRADLDPKGEFGSLELGACYVAGKAQDWSQQFHIQLSALSDRAPEHNAGTALRYMPDVVATASMAQLQSSNEYVVFVCAVLGELDYRNPNTWFRANGADANPTTNSLLRVTVNESDQHTWNAMDQSTFEVLERVLSPKGPDRVQYWHGSPDVGTWTSQRPDVKERRVDALVHESSTLHIGEDDSAPVNLDYLLRGTKNVYVTGGALWPQGGSWNPTMTMVALAMDLAARLVPKHHGPAQMP